MFVVTGADPGFLERGSNLQRGIRFLFYLVFFLNCRMKTKLFGPRAAPPLEPTFDQLS